MGGGYHIYIYLYVYMYFCICECPMTLLRAPESMELSKNPAITGLRERLRRHVDYTDSIYAIDFAFYGNFYLYIPSIHTANHVHTGRSI